MRTKLSMKKKTAATITAGVLVAGTAAGAYAYWTTTGSGYGRRRHDCRHRQCLAYFTPVLRSIGDATPRRLLAAPDGHGQEHQHRAESATWSTVQSPSITGDDRLHWSRPASATDYQLGTRRRPSTTLTWSAAEPRRRAPRATPASPSSSTTRRRTRTTASRRVVDAHLRRQLTLLHRGGAAHPSRPTVAAFPAANRHLRSHLP